MNDQYTPTTEEVRLDYVMAYTDRESSQILAEQAFDRWHAAEIAAAEQRGAARALREAAKDWRWSAWADAPRNPIAAANYTGDWIESRADRIADKEGDDEYSTEG